MLSSGTKPFSVLSTFLWRSVAMAPAADAAMPSSSQIENFFQQLEAKVPFPESTVRRVVPTSVIQEWENIGATQSVSWVWVLLCELSLVSFLTPNARFHPWQALQCML